MIAGGCCPIKIHQDSYKEYNQQLTFHSISPTTSVIHWKVHFVIEQQIQIYTIQWTGKKHLYWFHTEDSAQSV